MSTATPPAVSRRRPRRLARPVSTALALSVALVLVLLMGVPGTSTQSLRIVTSSMTPTLRQGDRVLVSHVGRGDHDWRRGDVVVLDLGSGPLVIKRIVGLPGDVVALRDGRLWRNGREVDEPWSDPRLIDGVYYGPVQVPAGEVLVFGDNRRESRDSRDYGPLPMGAVRARVVAVLWPPSRVGDQP